MRQTRTFWIAYLIVAVPVVIRIVNDADIWWHLQLGRAMVHRFGYPDLSTFYFSPLANHATAQLRYTWLGDILLYMSHRLAGDAGLQVLVYVNVLILAYAFSARQVRRQPWLGFALALGCLAVTYQLQIPRNAVFSLAGWAALVWILDGLRTHNDQRVYALIPVCVIWSTLHGSYIFGLVIAAIALVWESWDRMKDTPLRPGIAKLWAAWTVAAILASVWSPITDYYTSRLVTNPLVIAVCVLAVLLLVGIRISPVLKNIFVQIATQFRRRTEQIAVTIAGLMLAGQIAAIASNGSRPTRTLTELSVMADHGLFGRIKHAFNQTLWQPGTNRFGSIDFHSPFDYLGDLHVWSSLLVMLLALILIVGFRRRIATGPILVFVATALLGLGYVRTIGYGGLGALLVLRSAFDKAPVPRAVKTCLALGCGAFCCALLLSGFGPERLVGLYPGHKVGFGRAPYYSTRVADYVENTYPDLNPMTTVGGGGFLLFHWNGRKRVFFDGYYHPHLGKAMKVYEKALDEGDTAGFAKLGCELALINVWDRPWIDTFNRSKRWYPLAMDQGYIVYRLKLEQRPEPFKLFLTRDELVRQPAYLRSQLALLLFDVPAKLARDQRIGDAKYFLRKHRDLLEAARSDLLARGFEVPDLEGPD